MSDNPLKRRDMFALLAAGPAALAAMNALAEGEAPQASAGKVLMPLGDATSSREKPAPR